MIDKENNPIITPQLLIEKEELRKKEDPLLSQVYHQALARDSELLQKLNKSGNFDSYFAIYYYLLWNGYFSSDKCYIFELPKIENTEMGQNIYCGNGVCRNISAHFVDVLNEIDSSQKLLLVGTKYENKYKGLDKCREIVQHVNYEPTPIKPLPGIPTHLRPNHLEVMKENKDSFYLYDVTNFIIRRINLDKSEKNSSILNISCDLWLGNNYDDINTRLSLLPKYNEFTTVLSSKEKRITSLGYLKEIRAKAIERCQSNSLLINGHYQDNNHIYKYIKKELIRKNR